MDPALAAVPQHICRDAELSPSPAAPTESHPAWHLRDVLSSGESKPKGLCWGCAIPQGPQPGPGGIQAPPKCSCAPGAGETSLPPGSGDCGGPQVAPGPTCSCSAAYGSRSSAAAAASPAWWWTGSSPAAASRCVTSGSAPAPGAEGSVGVSSQGHATFLSVTALTAPRHATPVPLHTGALNHASPQGIAPLLATEKPCRPPWSRGWWGHEGTRAVSPGHLLPGPPHR